MKIAGLTEDQRGVVIARIENGDVKGARAELHAGLKLRGEVRKPKSKTVSAAAKTGPTRRFEPACDGFEAAYRALLIELAALPGHLASNPLRPDTALSLSLALRKALVLVEHESTCLTAVQIA